MVVKWDGPKTLDRPRLLKVPDSIVGRKCVLHDVRCGVASVVTQRKLYRRFRLRKSYRSNPNQTCPWSTVSLGRQYRLVDSIAGHLRSRPSFSRTRFLWKCLRLSGESCLSSKIEGQVAPLSWLHRLPLRGHALLVVHGD